MLPLLVNPSVRNVAPTNSGAGGGSTFMALGMEQFFSEMRAVYAKEHPEADEKELCKLMELAWSRLVPSEQERYRASAMAASANRALQQASERQQQQNTAPMSDVPAQPPQTVLDGGQVKRYRKRKKGRGYRFSKIPHPIPAGVATMLHPCLHCRKRIKVPKLSSKVFAQCAGCGQQQLVPIADFSVATANNPREVSVSQSSQPTVPQPSVAQPTSTVVTQKPPQHPVLPLKALQMSHPIADKHRMHKDLDKKP